eukprot:1839613-Rhodomonas_salina.1
MKTAVSFGRGHRFCSKCVCTLRSKAAPAPTAARLSPSPATRRKRPSSGTSGTRVHGSRRCSGLQRPSATR